MTAAAQTGPGLATLLLHGGKVITCDGSNTLAQAVAIRNDRILAVGSDRAMKALSTPHTQRVDLGGKTVIPGMTDGHAHLDREGLRRHLPSLQGARSIDDILDRIAHEVRRTPPGTWIITQPVGEPPEYSDPAAGLREGRYPTRHDLDKVSPDHPVYIRPIWGYWRNRPPLVSIANSLALRLACIDRHTASPSPEVTLGRDADGEPDGIFSEATLVPIVEHSLMRVAPGFSAAQRASGLRSAMRAYNAVGTTAVFEGHGVASEVIAAYRDVAAQGAATVRATLTFSPRWRIDASDGRSRVERINQRAGDVGADCRALDCNRSEDNGADNESGTAIELLRDWRSWLRRKHADHPWVRLQGFYAEIDTDPLNNQLRASNHPCTGWAGFQAGAALPASVLEPLLIEAAREGIRVCGIWPTLLPLYSAANKAHPIGDLRWVLGHQPVLTPEMVANIHDLGVVVTTHTNRHIYKDGDLWAERRAGASVNDIVPLRRLVDAGVPVAFGSDNLPVSLFGPVHHAVHRLSRTGQPIAPDQAIDREEALRIATMGGAWLTFDETTRGSIEAGKLADLAILNGDPLTCASDALPGLRADHLILDGRVHAADPPSEHSHE